jgi:hypothetical protein
MLNCVRPQRTAHHPRLRRDRALFAGRSPRPQPHRALYVTSGAIGGSTCTEKQGGC